MKYWWVWLCVALGVLIAARLVFDVLGADVGNYLPFLAVLLGVLWFVVRTKRLIRDRGLYE